MAAACFGIGDTTTTSVNISAKAALEPVYGKFCLAIIVLMALTSGCCTQECINDSKETTVDKFSPSAVYKSEYGGHVALEGMYSTNHLDRAYIPKTWSHGYLIISQKKLASYHCETNGLFSLSEIEKLPPELTKRIKAENTLPTHYEKVADLPTNNIVLDINVSHRARGLLIMLPFAFAADVVLFPFEALTAYAFAHGHE